MGALLSESAEEVATSDGDKEQILVSPQPSAASPACAFARLPSSCPYRGCAAPGRARPLRLALGPRSLPQRGVRQGVARLLSRFDPKPRRAGAARSSSLRACTSPPPSPRSPPCADLALTHARTVACDCVAAEVLTEDLREGGETASICVESLIASACDASTDNSLTKQCRYGSGRFESV